MSIEEFVKKSIKQDGRNIFIASELSILLPVALYTFYHKYNPVDVEITMDGNSVRFVPADELDFIQKDYSLEGDRFVFATCNSDPIYVYNKKIYTCYHGVINAKDELIAEDFNSFLDLID